MKRSRDEAPVVANRFMPAGSVIPVLAYSDVRDAVRWLCDSFGFAERLRIGEHRAQLRVGEGSVVVCASPPGTAGSPADRIGHSVMVRVADVDAHYRRAKEFGARIVSPPTQYPYGEKQYTVEDLGGHLWTFSQTVADTDPTAWGGILVDSS